MLRSLLIVYPREDLNLWPLGPQPSALSTELRGHMLTLHGVCGHCGRIRQTSRRGGRDLNPRGMYNTPTHLAGGRTRPGYATSPRCSMTERSTARSQNAGGGRGIRTPGDITATVVFKTTAIVRSAIPPLLARAVAALHPRTDRLDRLTASRQSACFRTISIIRRRGCVKPNATSFASRSRRIGRCRRRYEHANGLLVNWGTDRPMIVALFCAMVDCTRYSMNASAALGYGFVRATHYR